jgi:hypothetical protein
VIVPLLLFVIFWAITSHEGRFDIGSRDLPFPGSRDLMVGLAFFGDTMVWPFFLLVPLLLVLLHGAIAKSVDLMHGSTTLMRPEILTDPQAKLSFEEITEEAAAALCYRSGPWGWLWGGAVAAGLVFFAYNTVACFRADAWPDALIRHQELPSLLTPYELNDVVVKPDTVFVTLKDPAPLVTPCIRPAQELCLPPLLTQQLKFDRDRRQLSWSGPLSTDEQRELAELWPGAEWQQLVQSLSRLKNEGFVTGKKAPLEKWDTDLSQAPFSWWASRAWVLLLGYAVLPLAVLRVGNLIYVVWRLATALAKANMLKANPYSRESRVSLDLITAIFSAANYCLLVVSVMVALAFFKVGAKPQWHDLALLVLIPVFAFAAIAPLLSISDIFERCVKDRYLSVHARVVDNMHRAFHDATTGMTTESRRIYADILTKYDDYLSRGQAVAVFPISLRTIANLLTPVTPLVLALVEKAVTAIF